MRWINALMLVSVVLLTVTCLNVKGVQVFEQLFEKKCSTTRVDEWGAFNQTSAGLPQCSLIRPHCASVEHWKELENKRGSRYLQKALPAFIREHAPVLGKLLDKSKKDSLAEEILGRASFDPLIKAMVETERDAAEELIKEDFDILKKVQLTHHDVVVDYLAIAFAIGFLQDEFAIFALLLESGVDPNASGMRIEGEFLPLIVLVLLLNEEVALHILKKYRATLDVAIEGKTVREVMQALEDEFECESLAASFV